MSIHNLSIVMIAFNEADRLPACLAGIPPGVELILLDSGSTDRTVEIAGAFGANVAQRSFDDYASQRNAALAMATREWVFSLDADERITPELAIQLGQLAQLPGEVSGLTVPRSLVFMGRVMRFGRTQDQPLRIFRRKAGKFINPIHETVVLSHGMTRRAQGRLLHDSYRDLSDYLVRLNRYTSAIAEQKPERVSWLHVLRPWQEFFTRYVARLGFLDGYPGYAYAWLSSLYAYMKYAKRWEKTHCRAVDLPVSSEIQ
jgi:glycosyltransferase involved in cell wall biosynthesis